MSWPWSCSWLELLTAANAVLRKCKARSAGGSSQPLGCAPRAKGGLARSASLHVRRLKNGKPSVHPLRGDEIRALRELRRQFPDSAFVFATERGGPFTSAAVNRLIKRIGARAKMPFPVHAHMLRHACGYALANAGHDTRALQDWLGHRNITHTVRYTELSPTRFKNFWRQ